MKVLCAKKQAKLKKNEPGSEAKPERVKEKQGSGLDTKARRSEQQKENQVTLITYFFRLTWIIES